MRKLQKTEQADHQWQAGLEDQEQTGAHSIVPEENPRMSGTKFQVLVLDRDNLNLAYQRVVKNKGAAGLDGMSADELLPYLKEHQTELLAKLTDGRYKPKPIKRVAIPKPNGGTHKLGIPTVTDRMIRRQWHR